MKAHRPAEMIWDWLMGIHVGKGKEKGEAGMSKGIYETWLGQTISYE